MRNDCSTYRRLGQCFVGVIINFSFLLSTARMHVAYLWRMGHGVSEIPLYYMTSSQPQEDDVASFPLPMFCNVEAHLHANILNSVLIVNTLHFTSSDGSFNLFSIDLLPSVRVPPWSHLRQLFTATVYFPQNFLYTFHIRNYWVHLYVCGWNYFHNLRWSAFVFSSHNCAFSIAICTFRFVT